MIEMMVTPGILERAELRMTKFELKSGARSNQYGSERLRTLVGYIGEQVVAEWLNVWIIDDYDYDIKFLGHRYDVKTISCKSKPLASFEATVNSCEEGEQHRQDADYYIFVRLGLDLLGNRRTAWVVGYIPVDEFFERGRFVKKGQPLYPGKPAAQADATVLPISELRDPVELARMAGDDVSDAFQKYKQRRDQEGKEY